MMVSRFHEIAGEGQGPTHPWWYGRAYCDFRTGNKHYFPFPINWVVRVYRDLWAWFNYVLPRRKHEDLWAADIRKSRREGYREGYKDGDAGVTSRYGQGY